MPADHFHLVVYALTLPFEIALDLQSCELAGDPPKPPTRGILCSAR